MLEKTCRRCGATNPSYKWGSEGPTYTDRGGERRTIETLSVCPECGKLQ